LKIRGPIKLILILVTLLILLPVLGVEDTFYLELATQIGIFAAMAIGLNVVVGFAGLLDLGYIAFFAVGAYIWGVFSSQANTIVKLSGAQASPETFYLFLFIGIIVAAITGILLGLPVLRLRGDYLAIVTLGFGEMIRILVSNLGNVSSNPRVKINITNGAQGLPGISSPPLPQFVFDLVRNVTGTLGVHFDGDTQLHALTYQLFFYFLVLVIGIIAVLIATRLDNSPIGRAWTAIREDETAAVAMGVPRVRMKLLAFAMGASFAGAMGVVFAAKQTFVSPESFSFIQSIFILVIVIVGGMGSIKGVILGAVVVTLLNLQVLKNFSLLINNLRNIDWVVPLINFHIRDWPAQLEPARYERLVFGALLVVMMIFRPAGILPAGRRKLEIQEAMGKDMPPVIDEAPPPPDEAPFTQAGE
jgi:branched-chain amino acid transport system permease protein